MAAYVRSNGDLSVMKWAKHFEFEKLIGSQLLNLYIGAVGYGGTNIDCDKSEIDVAFFIRGDIYARLLDNKLNILSISANLDKSGASDLIDKAVVKIGPVVAFNKPYIPDNIAAVINYCKKHVKPLFEKSWPQLAQFSYTFVIVCVPVRLSIVVSASLGIDLTAVICPFKLTLTVGVEPWFKLGVTGEVGISIAIGSAGIEVEAEFNYRLLPSLGTANCNLCAVLAQQVDPLKISIGLYVSVLGKKWDKILYSWSAPSIKTTLFKYCLRGDKYEPYDPSDVVQHDKPAARKTDVPVKKSTKPAPKSRAELKSSAKQALKKLKMKKNNNQLLVRPKQSYFKKSFSIAESHLAKKPVAGSKPAPKPAHVIRLKKNLRRHKRKISRQQLQIRRLRRALRKSHRKNRKLKRLHRKARSQYYKNRYNRSMNRYNKYNRFNRFRR